MPRTKAPKSPTTTADDLEQQLVTDADLDALDVPRFDQEPSREQKLAELDARDERLNGHGPEGVRPSERCGFKSNLGISCTERDGHASPHSWQEPTEDVGHVYTDDQPELPGMPEEPQTDWTVPTESAFRGAKLMESEGLAAIGARLIEEDESLEHLVDTEIRYFWRRRGGTQGSLPRYGRIKKPSAYEALGLGAGVVFLLDLSADHAREAKFTDQQIEAQIHEQLCRTSVDPDDHDAYRIDALDFSGSIRTFDRFGAYKPEVREAHAHMALVPVEQMPALPAEDDDDEASDEEGEADE